MLLSCLFFRTSAQTPQCWGLGPPATPAASAHWFPVPQDLERPRAPPPRTARECEHRAAQISRLSTNLHWPSVSGFCAATTLEPSVWSCLSAAAPSSATERRRWRAAVRVTGDQTVLVRTQTCSSSSHFYSGTFAPHLSQMKVQRSDEQDVTVSKCLCFKHTQHTFTQQSVNETNQRTWKLESFPVLIQ